MSNIKPIATVCDYGKIKIRLKDIMDRKQISRNQLAKITNTRFEVINKWYNGSVERMDCDVLARLCYSLDCSVEDIIEYVK